MQRIYLDNAATTPIDKDVADVMHSALIDLTGNPSSIHSYGRTSRAKVEMARKSIASLINAKPSEIIFNSGATEAHNHIFDFCVKVLGVNAIITSKLEHYATLKPLENLTNITVHFVKHNNEGIIDSAHLNELLENNTKENLLVSLMMVNNETGTVNNIQSLCNVAKSHGAYFHTDAVQALPYFDINMNELGVDFLSCSAHKLHGPKGAGFLFAREALAFSPFIFGGSQEKGVRAGTENIAGILGVAKALNTCSENKEENRKKVAQLKQHLLIELEQSGIPFKINGSLKSSSPAIVNITFDYEKNTSMLLFNLDLAGFAVSGGSACTSGSNQGSHVLRSLNVSMNKPAIRVSFSKNNTNKEISLFVESLKQLLNNG